MFSNKGSHGWISKRLSTLKKEPDNELSQVLEAMGVPMVLLDKTLHIVLANQLFTQAFDVSPEEMESAPFYELGNGQWDGGQLREELEDVACGKAQAKEFEVKCPCPINGSRKMVVGASRIGWGGKRAPAILLKFGEAAGGREDAEVAEELIEAKERLTDMKVAKEREAHERRMAEEAGEKARSDLSKAQERIAELESAFDDLKSDLESHQPSGQAPGGQSQADSAMAEERLSEMESMLQKELEERRKVEKAGRKVRDNLKKAEGRLSELQEANQKLQSELEEYRKSKEVNVHSQKLTAEELEKLRKDFQAANEQLKKDLTESKQAEEALKEACKELNNTKRHLEAIIKNSPDPVISTDKDGNVVLFNEGAEELLGYRAEDVIGRSVWELYANKEQAQEALSRFSDNGKDGPPNETTLRSLDGSSIPVLVSASTIQGEEGSEAGTIWFKKDLRERKTLEKQLKDLSTKDGLTGCFNRVQFTTMLKEEFQRTVRNRVPLSFILIDIDHFRMVNDHFGHPGGDSYLETLAGFVVRSVRFSDIVARYGGDEMAVMLPNTPPEAAQAVAERIRETVSGLEVPCGDAVVNCTVSIGMVSNKSAFVNNADDFLKAADSALFTAKMTGRDKVVVWSEEAKATFDELKARQP